MDSLRWKNRVILVFAPEPEASNAVSNLEDFAAEVEDRDIAWFVLDSQSLRTNYAGGVDDALRESLLERYFTPAPPATAVLLIGKDGGLKSRSADLDLESTFRLIDRMPMRRAEMRRAPVE